MGANDPRRRIVGLKLDLPSSDRPELPRALREQLGLKLEKGKEPVKVMIIDNASRPSEKLTLLAHSQEFGITLTLRKATIRLG